MDPAPDAPAERDDKQEAVDLMNLLAYIYLQNGLCDKAATLLEARDIIAPDDGNALLMLAVAQVRAGKFRRALETMERLALLGKVDAMFHLLRAQALQGLEREEDAAAAMRAYVDARAGAQHPMTSH